MNSEKVDKMIQPETKGKNSALRRMKRKQRKNLITERSKRVEKALEKEKEQRKRKVEKADHLEQEPDSAAKVLSRFS